MKNLRSIETIVTKVTESGKSMYIGVKASKFQTGYVFGWCANPQVEVGEGEEKKLVPQYKEGDKIDHFEFVGREEMHNEEGAITHTDGSPVMRFTFM